MIAKGAVAAGHPLTVNAALEVLRDGGNAFDAAIAAHFAACVAEPVLASLGGGGFMLAQTAQGNRHLYDFFVQTPNKKIKIDDMDFKPIIADFGATSQEFHIGLGAAATPGTVKGLFEIHRELATMPMQTLVAPALEYAKKGVVINEFQSYIFEIVSPILLATPGSTEIYGAQSQHRVLKVGEKLFAPQLADSIEALANEGSDLFYLGEIGRKIVEQSKMGGGQLTQKDLLRYQVVSRDPLVANFNGRELITNPPPSSGGILIAFALQLWQCLAGRDQEFAGFKHMALLAEIMESTNQARIEAQMDAQQELSIGALLDPVLVNRYRQQIHGRAKAMRGTTHISVIDRWHNVATMTVSNGEGCGHIAPETGIMLNNMLGEEDLNPFGFQCWTENQRMTSMMAPTIINSREGKLVALGSGGSNRIRTALLQTILNLLEFDMGLEQSISCPRIHFENKLLNIEPGYRPDVISALVDHYKNYKLWDEVNLFFGGVHAVMCEDNSFFAVGDKRRGGAGERI